MYETRILKTFGNTGVKLSVDDLLAIYANHFIFPKVAIKSVLAKMVSKGHLIKVKIRGKPHYRITKEGKKAIQKE